MDTQPFDFKQGNVRHFGFQYLKEHKYFTYKELLNQDMIQVEYGGRLVLDIGWYGVLMKEGEFGIMLIKDDDWENPILSINASSGDELVRIVALTVDFCEHYLRIIREFP